MTKGNKKNIILKSTKKTALEISTSNECCDDPTYTPRHDTTEIPISGSRKLQSQMGELMNYRSLW